MSKYDYLTTYLNGVPTEIREMILSFEELESILGDSLPRSAKIDRSWWANTKGSNHGIKWLNAGWKVKRVDFPGTKVTYVREDAGIIARPEPIGGYYNLNNFLKTVPAKQEQIVLSLAEMGKLIGRDLPRTAFRDRTWWANTRSSSQGSSWVSAGWRVESVYLASKKVVFRRRGKNNLSKIRRYVRGILDGKPNLGHPDVRTLSKWIRLCRQVAWYFEGTVLFEQSGLAVDSMSEIECAELEEDYAVCKRELLRYKHGDLH